MNGPEYKVFLSYVHEDDEAEQKNITHLFYKKLRDRVQFVTGKSIDIFLDREGIQWGDQWRDRIDEVLSDVLLFIPIVTPRYFSHEYCRYELQAFLDQERKVGRRLVLPIYYQECDEIEDEQARARDELAQALVQTQYVDWRPLRNVGKNTTKVTKKLEELASNLHAVYRQVEQATERPPSPEKERVEAPPTSGGRSEGRESSREKRRASRRRKRAVRQASAADLAERVVVDPEGPIRTIREAFSSVSPGGEIVVRPGTYRETVLIDKTIHLSGDGSVDEIVLEGLDEPVLVFDATMGVAANITLRQAGEGGSPAVRARRGRLEIDACRISATSESCVVVDQGADVRVRRSVLRGGIGNGLEVSNDGQALVEETEILETGSPAIAATGGEIVVRNNSIHDCAGAVLLQERARASIEGNDLFSTNGPGIIIESDSDAVVRKNTVRDGKEEGILVNRGRATIEENTISGNEKPGVLVGGGSDPIIRANHIRDGKDAGIQVTGSARGTIEDNDIFGNQAAGVAIDTGANPTVRGNRIYDGQDAGIYVHDGGVGILEGNDIHGNVAAGLWISTDGDPAARRNHIHDHPEHGVVVQENGRGTLEDNDVFQNQGAGIRIASGGTPTIQGSRISKCAGPGVLVEEGGTGLIEGNDIWENGSDGVALLGDANPTVRGNTIHHGADTGVFVTQGGQGIFESNDIFQNARAGVWVQSEASPHLASNKVHHHSESGVVFVEGGLGTLEQNAIFANGQSGVLIGPRSNPSLRGNVITGNGYTALRILPEGNANLSPDNDLSGNQVAPVDLMGQLMDEATLWQMLSATPQ